MNASPGKMLFASNVKYRWFERSIKYFHCSIFHVRCANSMNLRSRYDKLSSERENNHAHAIVQKCLDRVYNNSHHFYQNSHDHRDEVKSDIADRVRDDSYVKNLTPIELCTLFTSMTETRKADSGSKISLEDPSFRGLCMQLVKKMPEMTDVQIINILTALTLWPLAQSTRAPNFKELWNSLDMQCVTRCQTWKSNQLLYVANLWALLHLSRISAYNSTMIRKLCNQIRDLDIGEVIQLLFFINLQREAPSSSTMGTIEEILLRHIDKLTLEELSVVALGFFKTKFKITNTALLIAIMQKIQSDSQHVDELSLAALMKLLRYSIVPDLLNHYRNLQQALIPRIATCHPQTVIHIALVNSGSLVCHQEAVTQMIHRFTQDLHSLRLKDISRSLYCVSLFLPQHEMSQKYALQIVQELTSPSRQQEINEHSINFLSSLLYLAYMNIFPKNLISYCLTWNFLRILKDNNNMEALREAYVLDNSVGLECGDYTGPRLNAGLKTSIFQKFHYTTNPKSHQNKMTSEIQSNLATILGGAQYCKIYHILPHFQQPDILLLFDRHGNPQLIPKAIQEIPTQETIIYPQDNYKWVATVVGGRSFYLRDCRKPSGISQMKLRQLHRLNYAVVEIPWFEYTTLSETERKIYLQTKISTVVSSSR